MTTALDAAREAFRQGDYAAALSQCDNAIAKQPNDTAAHEFRGLVLFSLKRYKEAAAAVYAVLSVGPGWDWTTLCGFYDDVATFTTQLRALEDYVRANPNVPDARFLLGYEYMVCGHQAAATEQFKAAAQLSPKDRLSAQLAGMMTSSTKPAASGTLADAVKAPAKPVDAAALVGDWRAARSDGATIALSLSKDGKYVWRVTQGGKKQEFTGPYSVADNLLILKKDDAPVMVGQVTLLPGGQFNFKLPGDNPSDPGLTFGK